MTDVAVSYGKSFLGVFCWAWPRSSCCFVALETKRKSGWGICGSSLSVFLRFCVMICPFTGTGQLSCVPPFSPLMSLSGPCYRAFTAKLEEKKKSWLWRSAHGSLIPTPFACRRRRSLAFSLHSGPCPSAAGFWPSVALPIEDRRAGRSLLACAGSWPSWSPCRRRLLPCWISSTVVPWLRRHPAVPGSPGRSVECLPGRPCWSKRQARGNSTSSAHT